jgi:hypothetical protein
MRALDRDKAVRCQSARELSRALEAVVVPATAANVSDWVEAVAGETLRDRASIVADIESKTALELTQADIGVAMADGTDVGADLAWRGGAVTIPDRRTAVPAAAPSAPDTKEMSTAPSPTVDERDAAPSSPEPQPATVPLGPKHVEPAPVAPSPPPAAVAEAANRPSSPPKAKPLPGTATLLSASHSPVPQLQQTLQSVAPPAGALSLPEARAVEIDTVATRKGSHGRPFLIGLAVVVVGALGGAYAASRTSSPPPPAPVTGTIEMHRSK